MSRTLADVYEKYVHQLDPILWEMGRIHGVHLDTTAQEALRLELEERLDDLQSQIQPLIPTELRPTKRYVKKPTTELPVEEVLTARKQGVCQHCGAWPVTKSKHPARKGGKNGIPINPCYKAEITKHLKPYSEWDVRLPFNPNASQQMVTYAKHFKHTVGNISDVSGQATMDETQLKKNAKRYTTHPIYKLARDFKKMKTSKTRYVDAWVPDEHGKIYGTYTHTPETFRLAQQEHNLMNVSHRGDVPYADAIRRLIVPSPGCVFIEADSSSIESVFSGYYMNSPKYMALAKQGIHAYAACQELGIPFTPENKKMVKNDPKYALLYARKKRGSHGVAYGMTARRLCEDFPEIFPSMRAAYEEIHKFMESVPELAQWHRDLRRRAWKEGYIESPWGIRNYYWQVFTKTPSGEWKIGEDGNAVIAFLPQHSNAMFQRENLLLLGQSWARPYMCAIGHIHDSQLLDVPEDKAEDAIELLCEIMTRPVMQCGGLRIGCEVQMGKNWADMSFVKAVDP